jgi:hypothetical protein
MLAIVSNGAGTFAVDRAVRKNDPLPVALPPPVLHPPPERAIRPQFNRSDQPLLHVPARPFQGSCIKRSTEPVIHEYPQGRVFPALQSGRKSVSCAGPDIRGFRKGRTGVSLSPGQPQIDRFFSCGQSRFVRRAAPSPQGPPLMVDTTACRFQFKPWPAAMTWLRHSCGRNGPQTAPDCLHNAVGVLAADFPIRVFSFGNAVPTGLRSGAQGRRSIRSLPGGAPQPDHRAGAAGGQGVGHDAPPGREGRGRFARVAGVGLVTVHRAIAQPG